MALRCITFADPLLVVEKPNLAKQRLKVFAEHLSEIDIVSPGQANCAIAQFNDISREPRLKTFSRKDSRLDHFYFKTLGVGTKYPDLAEVLKLVCCLSHGQAPVERGFSHNKNVLQVNMQEKSIISKRLIKDYLVVNKLKPHEVILTPGLMKQVSLARAKYSIYLEQKKKGERQVTEKTQIQIVNADISRIRGELAALQEEVSTWRIEARKFTKRGLDNPSYIKMAIELNDKADTSEKDIKKLEEALKDMLLKKDAISKTK